MDTHKKMRELVSALVDGEVSDADLELAFAALLDADGRQAWAAYHAIGDALRDAGGPALSDGFAARLAARLQAEPLPAQQPADVAAAAVAQEAEAAPPPTPAGR